MTTLTAVTSEYQPDLTVPAADIDSDARRESLIKAMLPLVNHIVHRMAIYLPPHLSHEDLISAGVIGLIDAVDRFDPQRGTSLKSYCALRIRGAVLDELRRLDWVPRSVHREARKLQEAQELAAQKLGREPTEDEIREQLGMEEEDFYQLLDRVKPASYFSLQEPVKESEEGSSLAHEEVLADARAQSADEQALQQEDKTILIEQLHLLPTQQMQVLTLYYLEDLRLKEIADILDLTESRVSQIHTLAIQRLRGAFHRARKK